MPVRSGVCSAQIGYAFWPSNTNLQNTSQDAFGQYSATLAPRCRCINSCPKLAYVESSVEPTSKDYGLRMSIDCTSATCDIDKEMSLRKLTSVRAPFDESNQLSAHTVFLFRSLLTSCAIKHLAGDRRLCWLVWINWFLHACWRWRAEWHVQCWPISDRRQAGILHGEAIVRNKLV